MSGGTAGSLHLPAVPSPFHRSARATGRGDHRMRDIHGEQYAQVDNADPFAPAVWRSPVHRTPEWIILLVQLLRLLYRGIWVVVRHPLLGAAAGGVVLAGGWGRGRRGLAPAARA